MKIVALQRLIKVTTKNIAEEVRNKVKLEKQSHSLVRSIQSIESFMKKEAEILSDNPNSYYDYYQFYSYHKDRINKLSTEVKKINQLINDKIETIHNLFIEKKRYQFLVEKYLAEEKKRLEKDEMQNIDEINIAKYRRKNYQDS